MSETTLWLVVAGVLVVAELATGTFYLLMMALGCVAAALAGYCGVALAGQLVTAAVVGGGATLAWHWHRRKQPESPPAASNRDVNLDVGAHVQVLEWATDGTTRVNYRGTGWPARLAAGAAAEVGEHEVVAVEGNWLVLAPRRR